MVIVRTAPSGVTESPVARLERTHRGLQTRRLHVAAEDVARIYMAMDEDDAVRGFVRAGDFAAVGEGGLDDYERRLLTDAAGEDLPDVSGFSLQPGERLTVWAPYRYVAINYANTFMTNPQMQADFLNFQNAMGPSPDG